MKTKPSVVSMIIIPSTKNSKYGLQLSFYYDFKNMKIINVEKYDLLLRAVENKIESPVDSNRTVKCASVF